MKILLDENLSPRLCRLLGNDFEEVLHVRDIGLKQVDDSVIWNYARKHEFVIVSKDRDFADRSMLSGAPPKVLWLRLGNCSALSVADLLQRSADTLAAFEKDQFASFCVLPPGLQI